MTAPPPLASRQAWRDLRALLWRYRERFAAGAALTIVNRLSVLVLPASCKFLIDGITAGRTDMLTPLAAAVAAASLVQAASAFALSQVLGVTAQRVIADLRKSLHEHVIRLPLQHFSRENTGTLVSRIMTDAEGVRNLLGNGLVELASGLFMVLASIGALLYLNWRLTLITIGVLAAFGTVMGMSFARLRTLFVRRSDAQAEVTGRLAETLGGIRIVKAYAAEAREHAVFAAGIERVFALVRHNIVASYGASSLSMLLVGGIAAVMMIGGGRAVAAGTMTVGDIAVYAMLVAMLSGPIAQIASILTQMGDALAGLDRIREILRLPTEDADDATRAPLPRVVGKVAFEEVHFAYQPGVPALRDISFEAAPGSTTALVGPSGAGKSTLVSLVMAFHRPGSGRILVDGCDLAGVRLKDYRRALGVVLQDGFLFDGTIADNVRFSEPGATLEQVRHACRLAHCDEFIERLPAAYDTLVGERGMRLSGGQRQRLEIARALLADPRILILDEATSNLDSESEALVQRGLQTLRAGRTTFVIAHRLSTVRSADQILVMEHGAVVARGTHDTLLATDGLYRQLYERQFRGATAPFLNPGPESSVRGDAGATTH